MRLVFAMGAGIVCIQSICLGRQDRSGCQHLRIPDPHRSCTNQDRLQLRAIRRKGASHKTNGLARTLRLAIRNDTHRYVGEQVK